MKGLKVVLFISFLLVAISGLISLISPSTMSAIGFTAKDANPAYTRIAGTEHLGFALAMWYAFRNPAKNVVVVRAVITWFGLEGLVLLISGATGALPMASALPGVIFDAILAILLGVFYPRAKEAAGQPVTSKA